ncbi:MAG: hypothetical protein KatS3mg067_1915 [Thermosynechococcus sp.]|nr:MAG: hypothetical protein KatS3mg067_1915 [Thermosynechococcus sp.]
MQRVRTQLMAKVRHHSEPTKRGDYLQHASNSHEHSFGSAHGA